MFQSFTKNDCQRDWVIVGQVRPFLNTGWMFWFFQSPGTGSSSRDCWKRSVISGANSVTHALKNLVGITSGPVFLLGFGFWRSFMIPGSVMWMSGMRGRAGPSGLGSSSVWLLCGMNTEWNCLLHMLASGLAAIHPLAFRVDTPKKVLA